MINILKLAEIAARLITEGTSIIGEVKTAINSTKEAFSTEDKARLQQILDDARARREEADRELQEALDALDS